MVAIHTTLGFTLLVLACIAPLTSSYSCGLPCSIRVTSKCVRPTNCELAKRPCGCCPTCALKEGRTCGAWTSWCEKGLWCYSNMLRLGFERVPPEMFQFRGICTKMPGYDASHKLHDPTNPTTEAQGTTVPDDVTRGKITRKQRTSTIPATTTTKAPPKSTTTPGTGSTKSDDIIESGEFIMVPLSQLKEPRQKALFASLFGKNLDEFKSLRLLVPSNTISKQ